ncbi:hypothetical protein Tco_0743770 [Tanacetum coccineum]
MDENHLIDVIEVSKQIDQNKYVIEQENELELDGDDNLPEVADPDNVAQEIRGKITRDSSVALFCYEKSVGVFSETVGTMFDPKSSLPSLAASFNLRNSRWALKEAFSKSPAIPLSPLLATKFSSVLTDGCIGLKQALQFCDKFICPYTPTTVIIPAVPATANSPAVPERTTVETVLNMLQQGESLNIQDVKTNLFWEFGQFTSHDGETIELYYTRFYKLMNEMIRNNLTVATMQVNVQFLQQLQPEWSRFVTIVKPQHKLDEVSYHKLVDILKQYQKEVNELCAESIAKNANPLALVATAQPYQDTYYQTSMSHKSSEPTSKASLPTRSHATTRHKGKEIAKLITPPSESASEEDSDPEQA